MREILNCEAGCHARTQKYEPGFDFRAEFSKKEDGSFYEPHKQNNKRKNISNYRIHKTSIQPYNKCGNEVISYIINTPERSFILASCFVFKDKFKEEWFLIGIIPQLNYWTRSIKNSVKKEANKKYKGYMLFHDLIDLELYDHEIWVAYENNLIKIFDKSIEEKNKKLERWNKLKEKIAKEKEQEKNQDNILESKKQETPISNTDPPHKVDLEQLLKDLSEL